MGILYGLITTKKMSSIKLGIDLRYILEALRKKPEQSPQSGEMFHFGIFALTEFKERLHEWPEYCSHTVNVFHLREDYASLVEEVREAVSWWTESQEGNQMELISTGVSPGGTVTSARKRNEEDGGTENKVSTQSKDTSSSTSKRRRVKQLLDTVKGIWQPGSAPPLEKCRNQT